MSDVIIVHPHPLPGRDVVLDNAVPILTQLVNNLERMFDPAAIAAMGLDDLADLMKAVVATHNQIAVIAETFPGSAGGTGSEVSSLIERANQLVHLIMKEIGKALRKFLANAVSAWEDVFGPTKPGSPPFMPPKN